MSTRRIGAGDVTVLLLAVAIAGCKSESVPQTQPASQPAALFDRVSAHEQMMAGWKLSEADVRTLEERLVSEPSDLATRTKLVSYYQNRAHGDEKARKVRAVHALYIISHYPAEVIAGLPPVQFDPTLDGQEYVEANQQWLKQVGRYPDVPAVLGNAAEFFLLHDADKAEELLKKAMALEPTHPEWPWKLGQLYRLSMNRAQGKQREERAQQALVYLERARLLKETESEKSSSLVGLAKTAFEAGDLEKAAKYAHELLQSEKPGAGKWNYGNAVHDGNLVLGRIALRQGKIDEAKTYLREAGKTPGSPQLNSFGPNLTLAKELLEKGEKQAVLEYFQAIGNFWKMGQQKLPQWTKMVEDGDVPAFGANLDY